MKPSHVAFVVRSPREGSDEKARWSEVGSIWPHKQGGGFDLVLHEQIAVTGRIVCTVRRDRESDGKNGQ